MITSDQVWAIEEVVLREAIELAQVEGAEKFAEEPENGLSTEDNGSVRTIDITGVMDRSAGPLASLYGAAVNPDDVRAEVKEAANDDSVSGVFLNVNSPGGKVTGVQMLAEEIRSLAEEKTVHAFANSKMASAAYWVSSGADKIMAVPSARVGSIAAVSQIKSFADMLDDKGIEVEVVRSGDYKQRPHPMEQLTDEGVSIVERRVQSVHDRFVQGISRGLGISVDEAQELADGRIYTSGGAKEVELIDDTATPEEAFAALKSEVSSSMDEDTPSSDMNEDVQERLSGLEKRVNTLLESVAAEMKEPKYSKGDKVKWSWQGSDVHGKVNDVGEQFTVDGNKITGEPDEPVYKLDEYDDGSFKSGNVAKPESSLSKSDKNMDESSEENASSESNPQNQPSDTQMPEDTDSTEIEARVDRIEESVQTLVDAVTGEDDAPSTDPARTAAEDLVAQYEDRIVPANREDYVELAMEKPEQARNIMESLAPNGAESDALPDEEAADSDQEYGEMEQFDDNIGRDADGRMIATNDEDKKVFDQLGLDRT